MGPNHDRLMQVRDFLKPLVLRTTLYTVQIHQCAMPQLAVHVLLLTAAAAAAAT